MSDQIDDEEAQKAINILAHLSYHKFSETIREAKEERVIVLKKKVDDFFKKKVDDFFQFRLPYAIKSLMKEISENVEIQSEIGDDRVYVSQELLEQLLGMLNKIPNININNDILT